MRTAQTVLTVIQERGKQHKPIERVYKLLFNRDFYLNAYAKLYPNNGAMTKGVTDARRSTCRSHCSVWTKPWITVTTSWPMSRKERWSRKRRMSRSRNR